MLNQFQKGLSPIGVLFNVCVFALILLVASKVIENYLDYRTIRSVFIEEAEMPNIATKSNGEITNDLEKTLVMNSIREWDFNGSVYFMNDKGQRVLGFAYEDRKHLFANIDIVMSFSFEKAL